MAGFLPDVAHAMGPTKHQFSQTNLNLTNSQYLFHSPSFFSSSERQLFRE